MVGTWILATDRGWRSGKQAAFPRWWYSIAKTRRPDTNSSTPVPVHLGMKLYCWYTPRLAAQSRENKMRYLKTSPRSIGSSQCFHIGTVCWSWSCAFFSYSIHSNSIRSNCKLQPDTDKAVTMLFCPWSHLLRQMVISVNFCNGRKQSSFLSLSQCNAMINGSAIGHAS